MPDMYKQDIFAIPYNLLKNLNIKLLIFDLDNTLIDKNHDTLNSQTKTLLTKLKKDFEVVILSNTVRKNRITKIKNDYDIEIITKALKPTNAGLKKIKNIKNYSKNQIAIIGDQLLTDIALAKRNKFYSILVDYQIKDIEKITAINRQIEKLIFKKNKLKRGDYYE